MNIFVSAHFEILELLIKAEVDFMLIGGYAVIYHGYRRTTGDMDLWLKPTNENKMKFADAVSTLFDTETLDQLRSLNFEETHVFTAGEEPYKVDFLTRVSGIEYQQAEKNKVIGDIDGLKVAVVHLNDLVITKMSSDRLKDKLDIQELQKIAKKK
ncbi:MAG TPA: nucleotidyltransferase [Flavipsychrobacter sp.]|nr:nucleotidyltransferase [Flavipsychrobacter sp.]